MGYTLWKPPALTWSLYGYDSIQPCEPIGSKSGRQKNKKNKKKERSKRGRGRRIRRWKRNNTNNTKNLKFALSDHPFDTWTLSNMELVGVGEGKARKLSRLRSKETEFSATGGTYWKEAINHCIAHFLDICLHFILRPEGRCGRNNYKTHSL